MAQAGRGSEGARGAGRLALDRVIAGHVLPTARELIGLIHDVNPTGRDLDKREAGRRYAVKARLQSLLVQRFADELEVVADGREGIVLLRHKYLGLAASHAVVADLHDDARAWVRLQLDLGVIGQAWTTPPDELERAQEHGRGRRRKGHGQEPMAPRQDLDEMVAALAEGHRARASYDYEAARDAFARAFALAPLAPAPLAALLDLLVNHLGLDQEALEIALAAGSVARQSPTTVAAMGLAAARLGERERAEHWAGDLDGAAAAEIFRTLAAGAVSAGDLAYATRMLARARRCLPNDPERLAVERQLDQARADSVAKDEAQLAELLSRKDVTGAAALARAIVERHPSNAAARAVLKERSSRERLARQQGFLDEARAAALGFRFRQARQALASARECGATAAVLAEVERAVAAAETRAAQTAHEKTLQSVAAQLGSATGEGQSAMAIYLGLGRDDRARVRGQCQAAELVWLDEIAPSLPPARCEPMAAALVAGRAAVKLLDEGDVDDAERILRGHRALLGEHGFGQHLLARLEQARRRRQEASALEALRKAGDALRAKDAERAKNLLDNIVRERLPSSSREDLDRLSRAVTAQRQHQGRMKVVDAHLAQGRPISARQLLLEYLAESPGADEQTALRARLVGVDAVVRAKFLAVDHVVPTRYLSSEAAESITNFCFDRDVETLLLPGGRTAILISAAHARLFAQVIDVDSGEVRRVFDWQMREAIVPKSLSVADGRIWIVNAMFNYAEISVEDWLPCRQGNLRPDGNLVECVKRAVALPGSDVAWMQTHPTLRGRERRLRLVDIAHGSALEPADEEGDVFLIPGTTPHLLACFVSDKHLILVSARGQDELFIQIPQPGSPVAIAVAPDGEGYVALFEAKEEAGPRLELLLVNPMGCERARLRLPRAHEQHAGVATIRSARLTCVCYREKGSGQARLAYLRVPDDGRLELAADVEIPGFVGIAQDPDAQTAVAVCRSDRGATLTRLDDMPTWFPATRDAFLVPHLFRFVDCSPVPDRNLEASFSDEQGMYAGETDKRLTDKRLQELAATVNESSRAINTYRLLRVRGLHGRADRLLELMELEGSGSFFVRLAVAEREALVGRWIGDRLADQAAALGATEHLLHVHSVALLHQGRIDEVIERLSTRSTSDECELDEICRLARVLQAEQAGQWVSEPEMTTPCLETLVRLIFAADRARARGDRAEVLRLLDQAWIRHVDEAQSMARLAEAYLVVPKDGPPLDRFKASRLLVDFYDSRFVATRSNNLWLGPNTFSFARLKQIAEAADDWLSGQQGDG